MKLDSKNAEAYKTRGDIRTEQEDFVGALSDYDKAIKYNSLNASYFNARGILKFKYGYAIHDSIYDFNKAIEIDSKFAEAYLYRGNFRERMKLYNDALKDYETAIKINPYYKEVFDARGEMLLKMGKEEEAKMDFDKVLQLSGTYF